MNHYTSDISQITHEQKLMLSSAFHDLIMTWDITNDTVNKLVKFAVSQSIYLEKHDVLEKLNLAKLL